jgi:hypothetical protein
LRELKTKNNKYKMKKIDEIFYRYAILPKGRMTEESVKDAMRKFAKSEVDKQLRLNGVGRSKTTYEKKN